MKKAEKILTGGPVRTAYNPSLQPTQTTGWLSSHVTERLALPNPKAKTMKCEATTKPCYWWDKSKIDFKQCSKNATVEIDGVKMCLQHAGTIAVIKLIHMGMCKKITDYPYSPLCELNDLNVKRFQK